MAYQCPKKNKETDLVVFMIHDNKEDILSGRTATTMAEVRQLERETAIEAGSVMRVHPKSEAIFSRLGLGAATTTYILYHPQWITMAAKWIITLKKT
jgi:hypothetical protein